jgi:hypothetical protein
MPIATKLNINTSLVLQKQHNSSVSITIRLQFDYFGSTSATITNNLGTRSLVALLNRNIRIAGDSQPNMVTHNLIW